ncbi:hypothetical protein BDZ90DRAFT_234329 [Jaminaea rosea]|uniref:CTLH domain-containing protein n=1 Tax=Jaminaea rosea TaxID=1569628 RepID=A0A316UIM4_9BASI|nr:hypothetical protein BDZ90DRAFT_234329 [Jaminaea rosea]PWN25116.1 hypothetical protein BDZ90DRAFT_234329 [Jaminaea rosea]
MPPPYSAAAASSSSSSSSSDPASHVESITSPTTLRKVVLNYLLHHCYVDTANAFAGNAGGESSSLGGGASAVGTAQHVAASSSTPATPRRSRHPLAAPPLSRQDSSIEVEADAQLLPAASGTSESDKDDDMHDAVDVQPSTDDEHKRDVAFETADTTITSASGPAGPLSQGASAEISREDYRILHLRQQIRDHILSGQIKQAIELLDAHFPSVLGGDSEDSSPTEGGPSGATKTWTTGSGRTSAIPASATSLQPEHLGLNLQIQAFIEAVRVANGPQPAPPATPQHHHGGQGSSSTGMAAAAAAGSSASNGNGSNGAAPALAPLNPPSRSSSPAPSSASSSISVSSTASSSLNPSASSTSAPLQLALSHAQQLYNSVLRLPSGAYRDLYRKEVESVTAILAYKDLERSPLRKFLDVRRRRGLWNQINGAIMYRTGRPSQPLLESAVRQTTFVWSQLHEDGVSVPAGHPVLSPSTSTASDTRNAAAAFATAASGRGGATSGGVAGDKRAKAAGGTGGGGAGAGRVMPPWQLSGFLAER